MKRLAFCIWFRFFHPRLLWHHVAGASDGPMQLAQTGEPAAAPAASAPPKIDTGDTTWVLASTALVMLMTPGLALFYGGMVRRKNVLGTVMHSFVALGIITVQWVLFGYSLAFGPDVGHFIGNLDWIGLRRGRARSESRLRADHPSSGLYDFPDDVCHHHPGPHLGRHCGKDQVQRLSWCS